MFYSNFLKKWTKTCKRCDIAVIDWKTDLENMCIHKENYWYNQFFKKYFIIGKEKENNEITTKHTELLVVNFLVK